MLGDAIQKIGGRYLHRRRKATEKKEGNMKIIRHLHATVEFIVNGVSLMVDPGAFGIPENLNETDAILVTHDHFDYLDHAAVVRALAQKPEMTVYGPAGFAAQAEFPVTPVKDGDVLNIKGVKVEVIGSWQAVTSLFDDPIENVGYYINDQVMHPGDAFPTKPGIQGIFLPLGAPWSKNVDIETYLNTYRPKYVFPYHDVILNENGVTFKQKGLKEAAERVGATFFPMQPGDSIEL